MVICIIYMVDCIWNARVRKHYLRSLKNKMNVIVRDVGSISSGIYTIS